eukprot:TRINITY_DN16820_c0_g1_i1.p1 TRINITY_DN16820_c0_g1~~TRINITY_DN16820_c0_g1_i1.p1  ORF type:complete len:253 (+),score=29.46 TRINITY_DN16820_c0_g1_i1:41-760(+)
MEPKQANFYGHLVVVVMFILWMVPGVSGMFSFYWWGMFTSMMVSGYTIKANYGMPDLSQISFSNWRQGLMSVQGWMMKVLTGSELHFLFFGMVWLGLVPNLLATAVLVRRSFWSICVYAAKEHSGSMLWKPVSPLWSYCKSKELTILSQTTLLEIFLGFYIVFLAVLNMNISIALGAYLHWSFLRMRYQSPAQNAPTKPAVLHRQAWAQLNLQTSPIFNMVPILNMPKNFVVDWFNRRG